MQDSSIIDLHCHSTASDGTYAPKEVAALAQKIGLSAIALTDHNACGRREHRPALRYVHPRYCLVPPVYQL